MPLLDQAFVLATQVAAPLLLVGTLFQVALGLLARLMPTIQVFFIAIPVQMLIFENRPGTPRKHPPVRPSSPSCNCGSSFAKTEGDAQAYRPSEMVTP